MRYKLYSLLSINTLLVSYLYSLFLFVIIVQEFRHRSSHVRSALISNQVDVVPSISPLIILCLSVVVPPQSSTDNWDLLYLSSHQVRLNIDNLHMKSNNPSYFKPLRFLLRPFKFFSYCFFDFKVIVYYELYTYKT